MNVVSAILFDRGFSWIAYLSGNTIILRNQTAGRVYESIVRNPNDICPGKIKASFKSPLLPGEIAQQFSVRSPSIASLYENSQETSTNEEEVEEKEADLYMDEVEEVFEVIPEDELVTMPGAKDGIKTDFGKRLMRRFDEEFDEEEDTTYGAASRKYQRLITGRELEAASRNRGRKVVFPVKKNKGIIENLTEFLANHIKENDKIAIIDDECDVSVSTDNSGRPVQLYEGNVLVKLKFNIIDFFVSYPQSY